MSRRGREAAPRLYFDSRNPNEKFCISFGRIDRHGQSCQRVSLQRSALFQPLWAICAFAVMRAPPRTPYGRLPGWKHKLFAPPSGDMLAPSRCSSLGLIWRKDQSPPHNSPALRQSSQIAPCASSRSILPWQTSDDRQTSIASFSRAASIG